MALVYILVVGYAGIYASIVNADPDAFRYPPGVPSWVVWPYFSVVTAATVGYGDVHPVSTVAFVATALGISTGPLLLAWPIAVFMSDDELR